MLSVTVELTGLLLLLAWEAAAWFRILRRGPEWKESRYRHFLLNVDLPTTCSAVGHVPNPELGCESCDDLRLFWAYETTRAMFLDPTGENTHIMHNDPRIVSFKAKGYRYAHTHRGLAGVVWADSSIPKANGFDHNLPATSFDKQQPPQYYPFHGAEEEQEEPPVVHRPDYESPLSRAASRKAPLGSRKAFLKAAARYR